jgi:hypothetical protein
MLRDDGLLVFEQNFWRRVVMLWRVFRIATSDEAAAMGHRLSWPKFIKIGLACLFLGQIQAIPKEDIRAANAK